MPKVLVVKLGAIGDVIMALPAARELHQAGWQIDWVVGAEAEPVLKLFPWIRTIRCDERAILAGGPQARSQGLLRLWMRLWPERYDLAATLYYDRRYRALTLPVRAKRRLHLKHGERNRELLAGRHHSDEYTRILLAAAKGGSESEGPRPTHVQPASVTGLPREEAPYPAGPRTVVLVPGGARNVLRDDALRRWPLAHYVALAAMLRSEGMHVALIGGADDRSVAEAFNGIEVVNLIGKTSLTQTLAVMEAAHVVVTHDTGPLHLAGMTRASIVAIFGPTDPHGRLPQRQGVVGLWGGENLGCRPCYDGHGYAACPRNLCMEQVTPERVMEAVRRQIASGMHAGAVVEEVGR